MGYIEKGMWVPCQSWLMLSLPVYAPYDKMHWLLRVRLFSLDRPMMTITLTLSDRTMEQAQQAAAVLKRPVEEILGELLAAVLPAVHDAPADMQAELMRMTWFDSQELWRMARSHIPAEVQERLQQLTHLQGQRALTSEEQEQLDTLRQEYGRTTLLKARAYALLSLRGGEPLLSRV
jgi:hypothetical protein